MIRHRLGAVLVALGITAVTVLPGAPAQAAPKDDEWWLGPMKIAEAHGITQGEGVVVGVVDSAVDGNHPALTGQVLKGGGAGEGWGTSADDAHGTFVAGVIAGRGEYLGIAPKAKILPYAAYDDGRTVADGIKWAADKGVKVINLSLSAPADYQPFVDAVKYALDRDVVIVAGAGNTDVTGRDVGSPARIPGVIAVSAMDKNGDWWNESSRGPEVALSAPGVDMVGPVPRAAKSNGYGISSGTSYATAVVSGVAALVRAKYPALKAPAVINRLLKTSRDNGDPGRDPKYGFGTVRAVQSLTESVADVTENPLGSPAGANGTAKPGDAAGTQPGEKDAIDPHWIVGGVFVVVVGGLIVLAAWLIRRRNRAYLATNPYGHHPPPPGPGGPYGGPPGPPQQWGPQPTSGPPTGTMTGAVPPLGQPYGAPPPMGAPAPPPSGGDQTGGWGRPQPPG